MNLKIYLTPREYQVLSLLSLGLTLEEVAGKLGISIRTVEAHGSSISRKTLSPPKNWGWFKTKFLHHPEQFEATFMSVKKAKEQRLRVYQLYQSGLTKAEIGRHLKIANKTVHDVFRFLQSKKQTSIGKASVANF